LACIPNGNRFSINLLTRCERSRLLFDYLCVRFDSDRMCGWMAALSVGEGFCKSWIQGPDVIMDSPKRLLVRPEYWLVACLKSKQHSHALQSTEINDTGGLGGAWGSWRAGARVNILPQASARSFANLWSICSLGRQAKKPEWVSLHAWFTAQAFWSGIQIQDVVRLASFVEVGAGGWENPERRYPVSRLSPLCNHKC